MTVPQLLVLLMLQRLIMTTMMMMMKWTKMTDGAFSVMHSRTLSIILPAEKTSK